MDEEMNQQSFSSNKLINSENSNSEKDNYMFLGNSIDEVKPSYLGKLKVLCYKNKLPCCTIGPDCK